MRATDPHYLLFSETVGDSANRAQWRFMLQPVGSDSCLAVTDAETGAPASRLELLAVVRGLEALDQPSRVTLLTGSRYVIRGIRRGLSQWRERRWRWERFGQLVPIRDIDLWQRVDRALQFHRVECCEWRSDAASAMLKGAGESQPRLAAAAACTADLPADCSLPANDYSPDVVGGDAAVVIVERESARRLRRRSGTWPLRGAFDVAWQRVSAQTTAFCRPQYTRAG